MKSTRHARKGAGASIWAPRRRRRGGRASRLGAAGVALALAASVASVSAATADNPSTPMTSPTGYVSTLPGEYFTASGTTVSGPMPGNIPGQVSFSTQAFNMAPVSTNTGQGARTQDQPYYPFYIPASPSIPSTSAEIPAQIKNCVGNSAPKTPNPVYCMTNSATLTFPQAVVDPVIYVYSDRRITGGDATAMDLNGCLIMWSTAGIGKIDGAAPGDRVSLIRAIGTRPGTWSFVYSGTRVVPSGSYPEPPAGSCYPDGTSTSVGAPGFLLQVKGLVTSLQVDFPLYQMVLKPLVADFWTRTSGFQNWGAYPAESTGFSIPSANLSVSKTSTPTTVDAGGTVTWDLTITNTTGSSPSHGFIIKDAIPTTVANPSLVSVTPSSSGCTLSGRDLYCGMAPPGYQVQRAAGLADTDMRVATITALSGTNTSTVGTVLAAGASLTVKLSAKAPQPGPTTVSNTAYVYGADLDPNTANNVGAVTTSVVPATWTMSKTAKVNGTATNGHIRPGDVITYTVHVDAATEAIPGAVITDDLSKVLSNASYVAGSGLLTIPSTGERISVPNPVGTTLTTPSFTLPASTAGGADLTYQVKVNSEAWLTTLINTASGTTPADQKPKCTPTCTTTDTTPALVLLKKTGIDPAGVRVPLAGAAFEVLADSNGQPGAVIAAAPVTAGGDTGAFRIDTLDPGTYWLKETRAPVGYELMAQPFRFTVTTGNTVTLGDGAGAKVSVAGNVITVTDTPAFVLPAAGGHGSARYVAIGGMAVTVALLATVALRRARRTT